MQAVVTNFERFGLERGVVPPYAPRLTTAGVRDSGYPASLLGNIGSLTTAGLGADSSALPVMIPLEKGAPCGCGAGSGRYGRLCCTALCRCLWRAAARAVYTSAVHGW